MLEVKGLHVHYGKIKGVKGIDFHVKKGEIVSLIGANGAGKTSILKTLSGLHTDYTGTILYEGKDLKKSNPKKIVQQGLIHVPEGRHVFSGMSVKENLLLGSFLQKGNQEKELEDIYTSFPILKERLHQDSATLSGGEQQMLVMGRALMSHPKLLVLDEPSMGLAPLFIQEIFRIIQKIKKKGTTILLVEQNAKKALEISDRGYVLETGKIVVKGSGKDLLTSNEVKKAYLGG